MTTLTDLRTERTALERKLATLTSQQSAAFAMHCEAVESLAEGAGTPKEVADAKASVSSYESAMDVIRSRLSAVVAEIAPLEAAVKHERQLRHLRELADRVVAVHAEALEQREQAAERVSTLINELFGSAAGPGGRLRELHQLLIQLRDATRGLSSDRSDHYGALSQLLQLPADSRLRAAVRTEIPGEYNPYSREQELEGLPNLGIAGTILDYLAQTVRPATAEELAATGG